MITRRKQAAPDDLANTVRAASAAAPVRPDAPSALTSLSYAATAVSELSALCGRTPGAPDFFFFLPAPIDGV